MRFRLYAAAGACLTVAAFTPGLANASPALAASGPAPVTAAAAAGHGPAFGAERSRNLPQPSGARQCAAPTRPLQMQCQSIVDRSVKAEAAAKAAALKVAAARAKGESPAATVSSSDPLTPADLQAAYGITSTSSSGGLGETVAVVDAYYDPNAQSDFATYRSEFGLTACGSNSTYPEAGCLNVYNQSGTNLKTDPAAAPPTSPVGDNWTFETSLDLEMVSAICPNCTIDLIEANSDNLPDLAPAEDTAVSLGAKFVSNSWMGEDIPGESAWDSHFNHPGVAIAFASGDSGYSASYPASSQFVTSVGGTFLSQNSSGAWTSTVWNDDGLKKSNENQDGVAGATGSGCSAGEPKASWGTDSQCPNRTQNDVSAVADSPKGIDVYDSADCTVNGGDGHCDGYGTSAATPIITAMYALAGMPAANTYPARYLYQNSSGLTRVTSGTDVMNGSPVKCESSRQYLCNAGQSLSNGYNGPAGLGTPNGNLTPFKNTATGDVVSVANPGDYALQTGFSYSLPAIQAIDSASGQTLTYSQTGLPSGLSIDSATGAISGKVSSAVTGTVHVTVKDGTGASSTVSFRITAVPSLTSAYHAAPGPVTLKTGGKCLDDTANQSANGTKVEIWTCNGRASQKWTFYPDTDPAHADLGTMQIHGMCMDLVNSGTANGTKVQLSTCNGGASQQWEIIGEYGELGNPQSGKCLDDTGHSTTDGTQVEIWDCNGGNNQNWQLPPSPVENGVLGKCLDDTASQSANGTKVESWDCNGMGSQRWQDFPDGIYADGTLRIHGKCVNAVGDGTTIGTKIQLYSCSTGSNYWILTAWGQIENVLAEKCLVIPGNSTANGAPIELSDCTVQPSEIWALS